MKITVIGRGNVGGGLAKALPSPTRNRPESSASSTSPSIGSRI